MSERWIGRHGTVEKAFWVWVFGWIVVGDLLGVSSSPNYSAFGSGIDLMKDLIGLGAAACLAVATAKGVELARSRGNEGWGGFLKAFIVAVAMTTVSLAGGIPSLGIAGADTAARMAVPTTSNNSVSKQLLDGAERRPAAWAAPGRSKLAPPLRCRRRLLMCRSSSRFTGCAAQTVSAFRARRAAPSRSSKAHSWRSWATSHLEVETWR